MGKYFSNEDKILQAVLCNEQLIQRANFNPSEINTISSALNSDNIIIQTIAKIIDGCSQNLSEKELYNEITNFLKYNV